MKQFLRKTMFALVGSMMFGAPAMADNTIVGAEDNSAAFMGAFSQDYTLADNQMLSMEFTNYSSKTDIWHNFYVFVKNDVDAHKVEEDAKLVEYAILRCDNYGWGSLFDHANKNITGYPADWWDATKEGSQTFKNNMDGASVKLYVRREGNRVSIYALMSKDNFVNCWSESLFFDLPQSAATENIRVYLTIDHSHINIDNSKTSITPTKENYYTVGTKDNNALFFSAFSDYYTIEANQTLKVHFKNYSAKGENWQNWLAVVTKNIKRNTDGYEEYLVLRSDHAGWGSKFEAGELTSAYNWDTFKDEMDGSDVVMTLTRSGATFTVYADITASDGTTKRWEQFVGTCDAAETLNFFLTTEKGNLEIQSAVATTISAYGWSTFSSDYALDFAKASEGLEAYMITGHEGNVVKLAKVTGTVPAGTGLLLKGTAGAEYNIPIVGSSATNVSANLLKAGTGAAVSAESGKTTYVLGVNGGNAEFQKITTTAATVAKGKAYLVFNETISAPAMLFEGDITGISAIESAGIAEDGIYYNLSGQRVAQPTKGLYIVNGKKVIVKK